MGYQDHADDCDKVVYEGGGCTCQFTDRFLTGALREPASAARAEEHADAVALAAMEDYEGPALDY